MSVTEILNLRGISISSVKRYKNKPTNHLGLKVNFSQIWKKNLKLEEQKKQEVEKQQIKPNKNRGMRM